MKAAFLAAVLPALPAFAAIDPIVTVHRSCKHETQAIAWHAERGETLQSAVKSGGGVIETWAAPNGKWTRVILWPNGVRCWIASNE